MPWLLVPLAATTVLCKSFGALVLLAVGIGVLLATRHSASRGFVVALGVLPLLYMAFRIPAYWSGVELTEIVTFADPGRAASLQFRLENENALIKRARQRPLFGWGGWGRARVRNMEGRDVSVTDGLWIIALGNTGLIGLASLTTSMLGFASGLVRRFRGQAWNNRYVAPSVAMCVMLILYFIDCLFNNMGNPVYLLAGGGLAYLKLGRVKAPEPAIDQPRDVRWLPDSSS